MQHATLPPALHFLAPETLRAIGDHLAALARSCTVRAALLEEREAMWRRVAAENAARPAPDTPYHRKIARREYLASRNIEIMRLAGRGWSNAEIAAKVALSAGRISQIIQRHLKGGKHA
jgi:DNA-binding NarL/FixJ family response regulator